MPERNIKRPTNYLSARASARSCSRSACRFPDSSRFAACMVLSVACQAAGPVWLLLDFRNDSYKSTCPDALAKEPYCFSSTSINFLLVNC